MRLTKPDAPASSCLSSITTSRQQHLLTTRPNGVLMRVCPMPLPAKKSPCQIAAALPDARKGSK
jgi:hypothetical protein